jgi:hypothetical protein
MATSESIGIGRDEGLERCPWCGQTIARDRVDEIKKRIQTEERRRTIALEKRMNDDFARQLSEAEVRAELRVNAVREEARAEGEGLLEAAIIAKADAEKKLETAQIAHEAALNQRLIDQRSTLEKDKADALNAERAKAFNEKLKLEDKLQAMQRQLQSQGSNEMGEGAEVDLFELLRREFPEDRIKRVGKGTEGADITHAVLEGGRACGLIIYDSKNRNAWRNDYVTKLRADQLAAKADHAVLATRVFPAGSRQLQVQSSVILCHPARVAVLVALLRNHLVQMQSVRISNEAKTDKMAQLYAFIMSERFNQLLDEIEARSEDLLQLDVKEKNAHDSTWKRRGELVRSMQRNQVELSSEIDRILSGPSLTEVAHA